MVLRLLEKTFVSKKINLFIFIHAPMQNPRPRFCYHQSRQKEITHFPRTKFSENLFFASRKGVGRDYGAKKMNKIKLTTVLVTSFDKFHHSCCLYVFGFCFVAPWFRFKCAEVWRFFNLTSLIFTKKYNAQE